MRRHSAPILASALIASTLFAFSGATAITPVTIPYPGDNNGGNLSTIPTTYSVGDQVELYANFASDQSGRTVTYYKETSPNSNDYTSVGTDAANSNGNAYLPGYTVNATQKVYARSSGGPTTEIQTLTPTPVGPVSPTGTVTGSLAQTPAGYGDGDTIQLGANFPSGTFAVEFYGEGPEDTWTKLATIQSNSSGNAYYKTYEVDGIQRVFARRTNNDRTEIDTITPSAKTTLSIQRDCNGNNCVGTATASGVLDPVAAGVPVTLQRLSGSSWVTVSPIGGPVTTTAEGKITYKFSLSGVPQWTTRTYRFLATGVGSNQIQFMPGPTQLGKNVLRVDVKDGVYPTQRGPEYEGKATLSVDGVKTLDHVALESFGVRGTTTSAYTKKPYKLKFLDKPGAGKVFSMLSGKSWTLLASWKDQAFLREKVNLDLGRKMAPNITWTPDSRYVEMFVNDQYRGSYILTESVKIDSTRVPVNETKGMIMEVDGYSVEDALLGFKSAVGKIVFAFKDPDEYDGSNSPTSKKVTADKLDAIKTRINQFETSLYVPATRNQYANFVDVNSAIDFWLVKEFTKDHDSDFSRSMYFWWDPSGDNKFHWGPAWDADHSAGNDTDNDAIGAYLRSPNGWMMRGTGEANGHSTYNSHWFVQLFKEESFQNAVKARWDEIQTEFQKVSTTDVPENAAEVGIGATNDRNRWASEPKRFAPHTFNGQSGLAGEQAFVKDWYAKRYNWMNSQLE